MAKKILLLRLEGVWQSWGARSRWDVRDTSTEPTKSGIVGLLGCALGYPKDDPRLIELNSKLRFGVRIENQGRVVQDYQTVSGFLPTAEGTYRHSGVSTSASLEKLKANKNALPATIISPRYYLEDAAFLVALEAVGDDSILDECADALQNPKWPIYLGRKACVPTRPIFDPVHDGLRLEYESIEDALQRHPWSWCAKSRHIEAPDALTAYVEAVDGELTRQDVVQANQIRQYGFRKAKRMYIEVTKEMKADVSCHA